MRGIQGQPGAVAALTSQLASGRVHHGQLFHGPVGVGKFTTAMAFARVVLCHDRAEGGTAACGVCESCRLLAGVDRVEGNVEDNDEAGLSSPHPDLHVITKELARYSDDRATRERKLTRMPVEVVRRHLIEAAQRGSSLRHGKVFILDEAELLAAEGQNALLKTLEEPPGERTVMILITSSEDRLLPTIRSRCQRIGFVPLPEAVVGGWLDGKGEVGGDGLTVADREWLVRFASGSLGRASMALRYGLVAWSHAVLPVLDRLALKKPQPADGNLGETMAELIDTFAKAWVEAHENGSKEAANRLSADLMWAMISTHARLRLLEAVLGAGGEVLAQEEAAAGWLAVIDATEHAASLVASNLNLGLVCADLAAQVEGGLRRAA